MKRMFHFSSLTAEKKSLFVHSKGKISLTVHCSYNLYYLANREKRSLSHHTIKQSIITRHKRASNHYIHKSNISKAVNQCKSFQPRASQPIHQSNILVSVFLFKCKLSDRFLTGTHTLAKAISAIQLFIY